jgi:hypothetical protein
LNQPRGADGIEGESDSGEKDLNSGSLAAGGKVAGNVCFEDPKLKGDYWIINEQMISLSSSQAQWKATI